VVLVVSDGVDAVGVVDVVVVAASGSLVSADALASCAAMAAPAGEMVTAESWLGVLVTLLEVADAVDVAVLLCVDATVGSDDAFALAAVCVNDGDDAALRICMAIFPCCCGQGGFSAGGQIMRAESRCRGMDEVFGCCESLQSFHAASDLLSALAERVFRVGKVQ
jgi:hypothetical protein